MLRQDILQQVHFAGEMETTDVPVLPAAMVTTQLATGEDQDQAVL